VVLIQVSVSFLKVLGEAKEGTHASLCSNRLPVSFVIGFAVESSAFSEARTSKFYVDAVKFDGRHDFEKLDVFQHLVVQEAVKCFASVRRTDHEGHCTVMVGPELDRVSRTCLNQTPTASLVS